MISHSLACSPLSDWAGNYQCRVTPFFAASVLTRKCGCFQLIHIGGEKEKKKKTGKEGLYKNVGTMKQIVVSDNSGH